MSSTRNRVAVIGASGIGRHHAKWWHVEGAEVCAFAGTRLESVRAAEETLRALFPFEGRSYTTVTELLEREQPDIVDVCSPPHLHYTHVRQALDAGCHVLCEKPFVYDAALSVQEQLNQARDLVTLAERKGLRLGLCVQYMHGARLFKKMWAQRFPGEIVRSFRVHLEVPARGRAADVQRIWADLGPHPLSALRAVCPDGTIDWDSLRVDAAGYRITAQFQMRDASGNRVDCETVTSNAVAPPEYVRELRLNDYAFCMDGVTGEDGLYCARIQTPDGEQFVPDLMRSTLGAFLAGTPVAGPNDAVENNEWLLRVSELGMARR